MTDKLDDILLQMNQFNEKLDIIQNQTESNYQFEDQLFKRWGFDADIIRGFDLAESITRNSDLKHRTLHFLCEMYSAVDRYGAERILEALNTIKEQGTKANK